jgi:hypothetical protein
VNARIDLAISAGLAECSPKPSSDDTCECASTRPNALRQLAALFAPLTTVRLENCEHAASQHR